MVGFKKIKFFTNENVGSGNGVKRMTVYDDVAAQLVEDAHYYQAVLK